MTKPEWVKGIFRCYKHEFSSNSLILKEGETEEDQWYNHLRDIGHEYKNGNFTCENCKNKCVVTVNKKVPRDRKAPVAFCSKKCEKEFLGE